MSAELAEVVLVEIDDVAEPVDVGLLRALDAVAEGNTVLPLDEHTCTIFFIIFISKSARVHSKHLRSCTDNFGKDPNPLILAVMQWVLRPIHKYRFSF